MDVYGKKYEKLLKKWHIGQKMKVFDSKNTKNIKDQLVVLDNKTKFTGEGLVIRPMIALNYMAFLTQLSE